VAAGTGADSGRKKKEGWMTRSCITVWILQYIQWIYAKSQNVIG
jgi:hypothetical protein